MNMTIKKMLRNIKSFFKVISKGTANLNAGRVYRPSLRISEICQDEEGQYLVNIQVINKNIAFTSKPEEILAKDSSVDQFSPRDIRTLTYLGYLGINSPKYQILAQRLAENNDQIVFAMRKKGDSSVIVKTAEQIRKEKDIIKNLSPEDAHRIGFTVGSESVVGEETFRHRTNKKQKIRILPD